MEQLMRRLANAVDRRSFMRLVGKMGMGAAAAAAVLLLPKRAAACDHFCGVDSAGPCKGKNEGDVCRSGKGGQSKRCVNAGDPNYLDKCEYRPE